MVVVHFCENLAGYTPPIAGFGAPLFMLLSGVSYRLWLNGQLFRDVSDTQIAKITIRRGLFLFGIGFVFNILIWLPEDTFNWDVLTLIGFGLITLNIARRLPPALILLFCGAVYAISPLARSIAQWPDYWQNGYFDPDWTLADVLQGFLVVGYFPVLPWVIFPLTGFVAGTWVFGQTRGQQPGVPAIIRGIRIGAGMIVISTSMVATRTLLPQWFPSDWPATWSMFPPSAEYVLGTLGFGVFSFCGGYLLLDFAAAAERLQTLKSFAATLSRYSLSAYILHHIVHVWPMWIYAVTTGQETTVYWQQATTIPVAILLACIYFVLSFILFRWMEKNNQPAIESAMRWICD
ncbi:MAG TPA: hypothetical protein DDZ51_17455 [Planctomycetaceae bacterium]|nr:hypothetical protein [Planctomycetaceae bacterium]